MAFLIPWDKSPCQGCVDSPCCTNLPVAHLEMNTFEDLRRGVHILYHPRMELGLYDSGRWVVYYQAACRHYHRESTKCLIHGLPEQPEVCREYSPGNCWYKNIFLEEISPRFMRFNLIRFLKLIDLVTLDNKGEIYRVPDWEIIRETIESIPLSREVISLVPVVNRFGCPAPAFPGANPCGLLSFPLNPGARKHDMIPFRLNFPGVELDASGQFFVIHSACKGINSCGRGCKAG